MHIYLLSVINSKISIFCMHRRRRYVLLEWVMEKCYFHGRSSILLCSFKIYLRQCRSITGAFIKCNIAWRIFSLDYMYFAERVTLILNYVTEWGFWFSFVNIWVTQPQNHWWRFTGGDGFDASWNPYKTPCSLKNKWLQLRKMFSQLPSP